MKQSQARDAVEVLSGANISKLSSGNDSDSGINSPGLVSSSRRSSLTSVTSTSSEESVNLTLNPVEKKKDPQTENKKETILKHLTKTRPKGPIGQRSPSKYHKKIEDQVKKESAQCVISVTGSQAMQPEKKKLLIMKIRVKLNNPIIEVFTSHF